MHYNGSYNERRRSCHDKQQMHYDGRCDEHRLSYDQPQMHFDGRSDETGALMDGNLLKNYSMNEERVL